MEGHQLPIWELSGMSKGGAELASEGKYLAAMRHEMQHSRYTPNALLEMAAQEAQPQMPSGFELRYEHYQGRIRVVLKRTGTPEIASE